MPDSFDRNWIVSISVFSLLANCSDLSNTTFYDMEFTGTFSEGISKADDHIIAAVMWSLTVRKYPVYLARMILMAVLWNSD